MNTQLNNSVALPDWLDRIIFNELGAVYNPDHFKFSYNLDHTKDDMLVYLGTYFPRSYAEAYIIMCDLLVHSGIRSVFSAKNEISILDLGCGTGGDIFGALSALADVFGNDMAFNIVAVDGNQNATRMFECVLAHFVSVSSLDVKADVASVSIDDASDMALLGDVIDRRFDLVLSFKAVNEFIQRKRFADNAYRHFTEMLVPKLSETGLLVLLDVATLSSETGMFYPVMMNSGVMSYLHDNHDYATLLPLPCARIDADCRHPCYMQQRFHVSHSRRKNDLSKVAYRVIGRKNFINTLTLLNGDTDISYVVNANGNVCCPCFTGKHVKDGFKLIL